MTKYVCKLEYPSLKITLVYCYERYDIDTYESIYVIYSNNKVYTLLPYLYFDYETVRKRELRQLYRILRFQYCLSKNTTNAILGAVGNLLFLIREKLRLPKRAIRIS